jgi:hypothetical protein
MTNNREKGGPISEMVTGKYDEYVKSLFFTEYGAGCYRQGIELTGQFLGIDAHIRYGAYWTGGRMGQAHNMPHVHDFDQIILWLGSDMNDLSDLHAEVEVCLGDEMETHIITSSTAFAIPKGFPHFPATINTMDKRIVYMEISITPEYQEKVMPSDKKPSEPVGMRSKYGKYKIPLAFRRKGAWTYGPTNRDDGGGSIAYVRTEDAGIDFMMIYENMKKAPYRIGPDPDKPHTHPTTQAMLFLGSDTADLNELGAEFEICLGKEEERHVFTRPTAIITPPYLPHWPGGVLKLSRPILMLDVHPFGNQH